MINDNIFKLIIYIVLIYMFEHKILPTICIMGLSLLDLASLTTSIEEGNVSYAFLYVVTAFYAAYMIYAPNIEPEHGKTGIE